MALSQSALNIRAARRNLWLAETPAQQTEAKAYLDHITKIYLDHCALCRVPVALPLDEDEAQLMAWLARSGATYKTPPKY